jgi:hypothetical protein
MTYDPEKQRANNQYALANPQPGDYWNEMFCPYFVVVDVKGDEIIVLSCLGGPDSYNRKDEPNARKEVDSGHWTFDYSKSMVVDRAWMEKAVKYDSIDGFVADVVRSEKTLKIVEEWRKWIGHDLKNQIKMLQSKYEEFTGWKYLKEDVHV